MNRVAALYVAANGVYATRPDVDLWTEQRDARLYPGPYPVVAHPPCARWCRLSGLVEARYGYQRGQDGGCFAAALEAVRRWGGVLEHPAFSDAWAAHGLLSPPRGGGWVVAEPLGAGPGWTCHVEQGHYGHPARKATWLYAAHVHLTPLRWGPVAPHQVSATVSWCHSDFRPDRRRLSVGESSATPAQFADILLGLARTADPYR